MIHLSVKDLAISRWGKLLQEKLSFDLEAGELLMIKGPNGIGKTSLLKTLAGIQDPYSGTIQCDSTSKKIFIGHENALFPTVTIAENLRYWAHLDGNDNSDEALDKMGLLNLADRLAMTLSAGQQKRANLARLLVAKAPIWLIDEPHSHLDLQGQDLLWEILQEHMANKGSAVLVSHMIVPIANKTMLELLPLSKRGD